MKLLTMIILKSENGRDGWAPVPPEQVPDWLKTPETMGRLATGEECMDCAEGDKGSAWYRAVTPERLAQTLQ